MLFFLAPCDSYAKSAAHLGIHLHKTDKWVAAVEVLWDEFTHVGKHRQDYPTGK